MPSIRPLRASHPTRPLIAWALHLLAANPQPRFAATRERLIRLAPKLAPVDVQAAAVLLPSTRVLLDIPVVIAAIIDHAGLLERDPRFAWDRVDLAADAGTVCVTDLPWELREQARFALGDYQHLPWAEELAAIPGHYAHLSTDKPGLIAFTLDAVKGAADKQTQIRPGRYLTRFYPDLPADFVRRLVSGVPRPATLAFARTADEIEAIYTSGPSSCMAYAANHYDSPCHPVHVYGDSDLALAYAVPPSGSATARALVWPEQKSFGRIYGDETLLQRLLKDAGYSHGSFAGARIRHIPAEHGNASCVVMPYLDGCRTFAVVNDNWLKIGGPFDADTTNGIAYLSERSTCDHCDERNDELYDVGSESWCEYCREHDAFCSEFSHDYFANSLQCEVVVRRVNGENTGAFWSERERDRHATFCDGSQDYYRTDAFNFVELKSGDTWVDWYFAEYGHPEDAAWPIGEPDNDDLAPGEREVA